jgi:hypothetical protein
VVAGLRAHARANDTLAIAGPSGLELTLRAEARAFGTSGGLTHSAHSAYSASKAVFTSGRY